MKPKCLRCGQCCHYYIDGVVFPCRYLLKLENGKTLCTNYKDRIGTDIYQYVRDGKLVTVTCGQRDAVDINYPGCPYNKKDNMTAKQQFNKMVNKVKK